MWLVLDIGNSAVKGGLLDGAQLRGTFRLEGLQDAPAAAWAAALREHLDGALPTRAGLASVVPGATAAAEAALRQETGLTPEVIHYGMKLPFALAYETPQTLGTDRLAAAVAAWTRFGAASAAAPRSVVVIDAGTAVTYEVIDRGGTYRGGAITPGPLLARQALSANTAQLPAVDLAMPPHPIGRSTREALQAGLLYGFVDSVEGMLRRLRNALGEAPLVVATGGWAAFLQEHVHAVDRVEPHLVLEGIGVLMEMNPP